MVRHKHGRRPFKPFTDALAAANENENAPQPYCIDLPEKYVDYEVGQHPDEHTAAAMCAPCPLLELCNINARQQLPEHGVWGGIAWVNRRQAHLLPIEEKVVTLTVVAVDAGPASTAIAGVLEAA
ncbi:MULTISPECIES: WhiB family transcriptional regulator [unclassified Microbacterium]|uniref:WhiB family transcriptional regulator n=1 Tax=unclassified Microbacterium TaxID=2609290 RepID=UPI0016005379|nr:MULTISPECIES: WhiB family transcriptional regulator [unclassified Microbacterium]MBT2484826.1 WhiB family transcriptional regulator [Microbacterium sp. ISL-108]